MDSALVSFSATPFFSGMLDIQAFENIRLLADIVQSNSRRVNKPSPHFSLSLQCAALKPLQIKGWEFCPSGLVCNPFKFQSAINVMRKTLHQQTVPFI